MKAFVIIKLYDKRCHNGVRVYRKMFDSPAKMVQVMHRHDNMVDGMAEVKLLYPNNIPVKTVFIDFSKDMRYNKRESIGKGGEN